MAVERARAEAGEQRRAGCGIAAETQQVLQSQPVTQFGREHLRRGNAHDLVAQRPEGVETHGLVAGSIGDDVGILAIRLGEVVVQRVKQQSRNKAARGNGTAGMAGARHIVEENRAQRSIDAVKLIESTGLGRRQHSALSRL